MAVNIIFSMRGQKTDPSRIPDLSRRNYKITRNTYRVLPIIYVVAKPADISIGKPKSRKIFTDNKVESIAKVEIKRTIVILRSN